MVGTKVTELIVFDSQTLESTCAVILRTEASLSMIECAHRCLNDYDCVQVFWHSEMGVCHLGRHDHVGGSKTCFDAAFQVMNLS